jgi:plasmid maintenance system antidote protein VapI
MKTKQRPTVASFIASKIKEGGKSQKEIAESCGWPKPNFVTMLKKGDSRLPLDKVGPLALALDVKPVYMFWLVMQEYYRRHSRRSNSQFKA